MVSSTFVCVRLGVCLTVLLLLISIVIFAKFQSFTRHQSKDLISRIEKISFHGTRLVPSWLTATLQGCYAYNEMSLGAFQPLDSDKLRRRNCQKRLPGAILIGIKKGGTSALKEFLRYHPQIAFAYDEAHYFAGADYEPNLEAYKTKMAYSTPDQVTMEKTPIYFNDPTAPKRIRQALPTVKLIVMLRDPIQRAVSDYVQLTSRGQEGHTSTTNRSEVKIGIGTGYRIRKTFEKSVSNSKGNLMTQNYLLVKGRYVHFMRRWLKHFSIESILVIDGDTFAKNPLPALKVVEEFLDIKPHFTTENVKYNEQKGFFCLEKPLPNNCLPSKKGRPHPRINDGVVQRLRQYYAPYNAELNQLLNRSFHWQS